MTKLSKLGLESFNAYKHPPATGSMRSYSSARKRNVAASATTTLTWIIKNDTLEKKVQKMQVLIERLERKLKNLGLKPKL